MGNAFKGRKGMEQEGLKNERIISPGKATFLCGKAGVYQVDYLINAGHVIPDGLVKFHIPGKGWNCN